MTHAIEARQLTLDRRADSWSAARTRALDGIELDIPEGAVVGLVGRNGAG